MAVSINGINGRFLRVYSGNGFFANLFQVGQPDMPGMEPRAETAIQTDGGRMTDFAATYITDETTPFEGVPISFTVASMSERTDMQRALGNWQRWSPWTVGGDTWTPVLPANLGTRLNSAGVATLAVPPKDAVQLAYMVNLALEEQVPSDAPSGTPTYAEFRGLVVNTVNATTENQLNFYQLEGTIYGAINWTLSDWPAGTESILS